MKNLELRSALIKSGALLALCIFLIYAFAVDDSGGIGGTISSLISAIVFLFGLTIALILSISILFGIYFGILYLYDPDVSKKTYEELIDIGNTASAKLPIRTKCCSPNKAPATNTSVSKVSLQAIETNQAKLGDQLANIGSTVETLQKTLKGFTDALSSAKDEIVTLEEKTASFEEAIETKATTEAIDESSKKLSTELENLKGSIKPITDKLTSLEDNMSAITPDDDSDGDDFQVMINKTIDTLKGDIEVVQNDVAKLNATPVDDSKISNAAKITDAEHRILSYFSKKADTNMFVSLVTEAVEQGMTYAQIDSFLGDSLSKEAFAIIAGHPSLTKDYIRTIRQQS
jgi:prefoldin subunit 5